MIRRLLLTLALLASVAHGGAVPEWLWKLKTAKVRPAPQRNSIIAETPKLTDGEVTYKHRELNIEIKQSVYATLTDAAKGDYELVIASRKARAWASGNAWGGAKRGSWASTVAVQYAGEAEAVDVAEIANGRRYTLKTGTLEVLHLPQVEFPNGETFVPEDGLSQFNIVLAEKPAQGTNAWAFRLDLPEGAQLYLQPKLSPAEIADGATRPEWVVGSYAVFAPDGRKLGHIPRPYAVAADGKWTWGVWAWNAGTATLTKTFDDKWLQAAKYPVVVDLTLGNTSIGASTLLSCNDRVRAAQITTTSAGVLRSIHWYADVSATTTPYTMGLYSDSGGNPLTRLVDGPSMTTGNTAPHWFASTLDSNYSLAASTAYWSAIYAGAACVIYYDDPGVGKGRADDNAYSAGVMPTPLPTGTFEVSDDTVYYSTYIVYTETIDTSTFAKQATIILNRGADGTGTNSMSLSGPLTYTVAYVKLENVTCDDTGADIRFTASTGAAVATLLHETEKVDTTGGVGSYTVHCFVGTGIAIAPGTTIYGWTDRGGGRSDNQAPEAVWAPGGYVGVWHLGEAAGSASDSTVYDISGTFNGDLPDAVTGAVGSGQDCDGTGDVITTATHISGADSQTVSIWAKASAFNNLDRFLDGNYWMIYSAGTDVIAAVHDGTSYRLASDTAPSTGSFHHLVGRWHGSDVDLFIDGILVASSATYGGSIGATSNPVGIGGNRTAAPGNEVTAVIDEARNAHAVRTADDIKAEHGMIANQGTHVSGAGTWSAVAAGGEGWRFQWHQRMRTSSVAPTSSADGMPICPARAPYDCLDERGFRERILRDVGAIDVGCSSGMALVAGLGCAWAITRRSKAA